MTGPTEQDERNAVLRAAVADRFRREYAEALAHAAGLFGEGWEPTGRHSLVTHAEAERARLTGGRPAAAMTVVTAKNPAGDARHFVVEDGRAREVAGWREAFGDRLTEPDPDRRIEVGGRLVHPHRYQLHWSGFEPDYRPRSAGQLAAARERREAKAEDARRRAVEEAAEASLFPTWVREVGYVPDRKGKGR